jgi:hypothetical protein
VSAPTADPQLFLAVYTTRPIPPAGRVDPGRRGRRRPRDDAGEPAAPGERLHLRAPPRATRALPDDRLLGLLLLPVAGNFVVDRGASALPPQEWGVVVDGGTGAFVLRNGSMAARSVIL